MSLHRGSGELTQRRVACLEAGRKAQCFDRHGLSPEEADALEAEDYLVPEVELAPLPRRQGVGRAHLRLTERVRST